MLSLYSIDNSNVHMKDFHFTTNSPTSLNEICELETLQHRNIDKYKRAINNYVDGIYECTANLASS